MTRKQKEREWNRRDCTCDQSWSTGHHHRICKAWKPMVIVTKRYESGFRSKKRQERGLQ